MTIAHHLISRSHFLKPSLPEKAKLKPVVLQPFSFLQDRDTIRFIQDTYPYLSFMFVCNKIDTSAETKQFDNRTSDEIDSEDEETTIEFDKQRTVFSQLQSHGLIGDDDSYETCCCFYGISAQDVREERLHKRSGKATQAFSRFKEGLLAVLDETVKLQAKQEVYKLILFQMALAQAAKSKRLTLSWNLGLFGGSLTDTAKSVGKSLHDTLMSTIANKVKVGMLVNCNLMNLEERLMSAAELYQYHGIKSGSRSSKLDAKVHYLLLVRDSEDEERPEFSPQRGDAPFLQFLVSMKEAILDRTFNVLKRGVEVFLKGATDHVEIHSRRFCNLHVGVAYEVVYGSWLLKTETSSLPKADANGLTLIKRTVSVALRKILKKLIMEGVFHVMTEWKSPTNLEDRQSRRKIMEQLFSKLNSKAIAESICAACSKSLEDMHDDFFKFIDDLSQLSHHISTKTSKQMEERATLYLLTVVHLVVKTFALQFLLTKGPLVLGPALKATKHGQLHECAGWADESTSGACVMKVIKEEEVEAEVWAQTSIVLFNTM